jgi:Protein of unknown function (DUF3866)
VTTQVLWRSGHVLSVQRSWSAVRELVVELDAPLGASAALPSAGAAEPDQRTVLALAYLPLVGAPQVGDRVLLTVGALARGLGTGGYAMVAALPDRLPADPPPSTGHLVKSRYMPLQAMVMGVDEQDSPHHALLRDADDLFGLPVVVADLHSALPAVVAGIRVSKPAARVVYLLTDGGALPAWFSRSLAALREAGWVAGSVSVGQAFGGDAEAVTVHSGLLAARHVLGADVVVLAQGPGNLGTGTRWGFSGVACGEAVNAVGTLGGRPIASLRVSAADPRPRHRGVSHHSMTAYGRVALLPADVVVPDLTGELGAQVLAAARRLCAPHGRHRLVQQPVDGLMDALRSCPVTLSTMGRRLDDDAPAFLAPAAAGRYAASLVGDAPSPQPV